MRRERLYKLYKLSRPIPPANECLTSSLLCTLGIRQTYNHRRIHVVDNVIVTDLRRRVQLLKMVLFGELYKLGVITLYTSLNFCLSLCILSFNSFFIWTMLSELNDLILFDLMVTVLTIAMIRVDV